MDKYEKIGERSQRALLLSMKQTIDEICADYKIHQCDKDSATGWQPFIGYWTINRPEDE